MLKKLKEKSLKKKAKLSYLTKNQKKKKVIE